MANVLNVARYVVSRCAPITTLKLQKLVYYCQAWSLAWDGKPLFDEDFQAWANGPVCPKLFHMHKGMFVVDTDFLAEYEYDDFSKEELETMDVVMKDLSHKSPQWLSDLTHSERPWKEARGACPQGEKCDEVIDKYTMQEYYGGLK